MRSEASLRTLLACLRGFPPSGVDWDQVIAAANRTLTVGIMAERIRLNGNEASLPDDVRSFLSAMLGRTLERNGRMHDQVSEAIRALNGCGITPILLKGIAACLTPGESEYRGRILSDLDLMVPHPDRDRSVQCLEGIGYEPQSPIVGSQYPVDLGRVHDVGMIDLHCQLRAPRPYYDFAAIEPHCLPIDINGATALLPSPTFQALILMLHDQLQDRDYWRGLIDLRHLLDIDRLARSGAGIDWGLLSEQFPAGYPQAALRTQLLTIRNLLDIPVPRHLTGGWWPQLQYKRRMLQANWPSLAMPLTWLTLALDFPFGAAGEGGPGNAQPRERNSRPGLFTRTLSAKRRFSRAKAIGKL